MNQEYEAWNKTEPPLIKITWNVTSPLLFTSKDWIVRWGSFSDPVFATRVHKM